jgi:glycosyltransferase involved in cell wall biosynthesis
MNSPLLSIVVPCYNEGDSMSELLEAYAAVINRTDIEVVLVNNGSTDNTQDVLESLRSKYIHFLKVVSVEKNEGYGHGIVIGLKAASGEFIGWTHGDLQTPPSDILKALDIIERENKSEFLFIKGKRKGRPLSDGFFTAGMSIFETIYFRILLRDIFAQPNIFHRNFFATWENPPRDFALDLYVLYTAKKRNLRIIRLSVCFLTRKYGQSSWNTGLSGRLGFIKRNIYFSIELKRILKKK